MAVPIILAIIGITTAAGGSALGIRGGVKMKSANDTMKKAETIQKNAITVFAEKSEKTIALMDCLGKQELKLLNTFQKFSDIMEKIQGRPEFKTIVKENVGMIKFEPEELKTVSTGAGVLLGGLGGAVAGTAGGFAAAGATTSAMMVFGTAATGVEISALSGVAATNATLAALGGGAIAAGGGGMALGSALLGGATLGVGLMFGGLIFNITGSKLDDDAHKALEQAKKTEEDVQKIVHFYNDLSTSVEAFGRTMAAIGNRYISYLEKVNQIVNKAGKSQWEQFDDEEKLIIQNTVLLVGIIYNMCKIQLVLKGECDGLNTVNNTAIRNIVQDVNRVL